MKYRCIENKHNNSNFILGKDYAIKPHNRIECEMIHLDLEDTKLTDEFEFAMCKFKMV